MRIVAGTLRGRVLRTVPGLDTRPTAARVREALFGHLEASVLENGFDGRSVLDLFAGSGALAFEALSRGAADATLLDGSRAATDVQRQNAELLGVASRTRCITATLPAGLKRVVETRPVSLVFCDPPYDLDVSAMLGELAVASWLHPRAVLVYESRARDHRSLPGSWELLSRRLYGETAVLVGGLPI